MTDDVRVLLHPLPGRIRSFVALVDDCYTVVINEYLSDSARIRAYEHEMLHIRNGDCRCEDDASCIELLAHGMQS